MTSAARRSDRRPEHGLVGEGIDGHGLIGLIRDLRLRSGLRLMQRLDVEREERISLTSTLKDSGMPAAGMFSPLTMAS